MTQLLAGFYIIMTGACTGTDFSNILSGNSARMDRRPHFYQDGEELPNKLWLTINDSDRHAACCRKTD